MEKVTIQGLYGTWGVHPLPISPKGMQEACPLGMIMSSSPRWCERWKEPHVGTWERALGAGIYRLRRGSVAGSGGRLGRLWGRSRAGRVPAARLALQRAERRRAERSSSRRRRNAPRGCLDDPLRLPRSAAGGGGAATTRAISTLPRPRRVCWKGAAWRSWCGS